MSLRRSASQVSPQILSLLVLYPNIPDKPPKPGSLVACGLGFGVGERGAGLAVSSRGFSFVWLVCARAASAFFIWVHSQRETWVPFPRPTGSLTARVLGNGGSAPPQVSIWGVGWVIPRVRPRQSSPGTARLISHRLVSAEPHALAATHPLSNSLVFPHIRRKACLSRWLVYCLWSTTQRSHEITRPSPRLVTPSVAS